MQKLQTLKGFRDFLPSDTLQRSAVVEKIKSVFERFGFDPLETPALEYAEVLLGKYGEDADKLIYSFEDRGGRKVGLRYDQTVPTARVVAQYSNELPNPFKRYQIQPVWRSENTQKGRYREFLQCDADIIGTTYSPLADAEILALFYAIYEALGLKDLKLLVNSRIILREVINKSCGNVKLTDSDFLSIVRSIDKLDKVGESGVKTELEEKAFKYLDIDYLLREITDNSIEKVQKYDEDLYKTIQIATKNFGIPNQNLVPTFSLARGLDYYTGLIFEMTVVEGYPGSLGGGGRYDKLIESLGGPDIPAVGFAVGFDRTLEALQEKKLISDTHTLTQVLVAYIDDGKSVFPTALNLTSELRSQGINTEIYLDPKQKDLTKQLKYADKKQIPFVAIIGSKEIEANTITLKNMKTGESQEIAINDLPSLISHL